MANNKFMETFDSETEVLRKIEELKAQGAREEDMYVMANDKDQISMVRGRTDVDYKSTEGNWMDKFMGFLSGNEPVREAFSGMGVDEEEADRYYREVQNGKILLFVDREFGANYEGKAPVYDNTAYSDPETRSTTGTGLTGAAGVTGAATTPGSAGTGNTGRPDTGAVGRDGLTVDTNEANDTVYNEERDLTGSEGRADTHAGTDDTAGVGRDAGTGFGLGSDKKVDDVGRDTTDSTRFSDTESVTGDARTDEEKLRLHEERLNVNKENVKTGEVNVGKHVVEEEQSIEVPVEREEVYVERRPVNEEATDGTLDKDSALTGDAYREGEDIHIPVTEEKVDVSKRDVVSEEIVVGKKKVKDTETIRDTVRREEVDIDDDTTDTTLDRDRGLDRDKKDRF